MSSNSIKQDNIVMIQSFGKKTEKFKTWKYWEIVGELIWRGADRFQAEDAARWCLRAEVGSEMQILSQDQQSKAMQPGTDGEINPIQIKIRSKK